MSRKPPKKSDMGKSWIKKPWQLLQKSASKSAPGTMVHYLIEVLKPYL